MYITKIHIDGFGKLNQFDLTLEPGLNLLIGPNEAGKSTLHLFIRSMLYGAETRRRGNRRPVWDRMRPWKNPAIYGGWMEMQDEGILYRITRNFSRAADDIRMETIQADGTCRELSAEETAVCLPRLLHDLSETAYANTVSAGQLSSATERDMAGELRRYAANVSGTANPDLSAEQAIAHLKQKRSVLETQLHPEAARNYAGNVSAIRRLEESLLAPELENRLLELEQEENDAAGREEKLAESLQSYGEIVDQKRLQLDRHGLAYRETIDETRNSLLRDYGIYETMAARTRQSAGTWPLFLLVMAVLLLAVSYKFRREYLFVMPLIAGIGCLAAAVLLLLRHRGTQKELEERREDLELRLRSYTGSTDLTEDNLHRFENEMYTLRRASEELIEARAGQEAARDELNRLQEAADVRRKELLTQQENHNKVETDLRELHRLQEESEALKRQLEDNRAIQEQMEAVDLALETMGELQEEIRGAVGTYINREASRMLQGLTGGAYSSVNAGQSYDINLNSHDGMISVRDVSAGTADQVYLAMRLATIRFIAGEDDAIPLVLDDSFALYDDTRLRKAVRFLAENFRGQMLVFSCQQREEEALSSEGLPHHTICMN